MTWNSEPDGDSNVYDLELVRKLHSTTDANVWASAFCQIAKTNYGVDLDEGWVIGWFANAFVTAEIQGARR